MLGSLRRNRNISTWPLLAPIDRPSLAEHLALFAGFAFNFVKIVCDCVLVASAMVKSGLGMRLVWRNRS